MPARVSDARQLEFVRRYLTPGGTTYGNAYASAKAAGYSESYAKTITAQAPWLSELIGGSELVTSTEVINGIKAETNTDKSSDRLKAWELLGKHLKLFTDKTELTGDLQFVVTRGETRE